jgi:hypothetical protein
MAFSMRRAAPADAPAVSGILLEAATWLESTGQPLWNGASLSVEQVNREIDLYFLAESEGTVAGTLRFQTEDRLFWPDPPEGDAAYVHRLAIRRGFAGGTLSHDMLTWARVRARSLGKRYLRLDYKAARPKLRAVYENFGFVFHSERQVGPYHVARYEYKL